MSEGVTFGAYRVVRKLGQGGMGAVYLAEHTLIGRRAAIKVLHGHRSSQRDSVERFFNEARATSAMEDPGIVQVYDFGVTDTGTAYLIMEYLDGEALSARLRRRFVLEPAEAVRLARQVAGSLAAAHAAGIVHRDLKPENLFIVRDAAAIGGERAKILDFGIAKLGDRSEMFKTRTGAVIGTPAYMSPEQCNDTGKVDHRTDIYSLGCVLYHLLVGQPPFRGGGVNAIISGHLREPPPVPSVVKPHLPPTLDPILARCLAKQPGDRFQSMTELQQACDAALAQLPTMPSLPEIVHATPPVREDNITTLGQSVGETSLESRRARIGVWAAVAAVAIAAGIVLAVTTSGHHDSATPVPAAVPVAPPEPIVEPIPQPASAPADAPEMAVPPPAAVPSQQPPPRPVPVKKPPQSPKKKKLPIDVYEDRT